MARTIMDFRAEYGVRLDTLAETTGISKETLANCERLLPAPAEITQIIIEKYNLPLYYFTGIPSAVNVAEKSPDTADKFILPALVWILLTDIVASAPIFIGSVIFLMMSAADISPATLIIVNRSVSGVSLIWRIAVIIISCNIFAKILREKYGFSDDKQKFKYLYWVIPAGVTGVVSLLLSNIFYNSPVIGPFISVCSLIGAICTVALLAFMLKAVSVNGEKDRLMLKLFYVICGANAILCALISLIFGIIHGTLSLSFISTAVSAVIMAATAAALTAGEKIIPDENVRFTYLPLAYLVIPCAISLIVTLFGF